MRYMQQLKLHGWLTDQGTEHTYTHKPTNILGERHIKGLLVKCDNIDSGCEWVGELNSLQQHCSNCIYSIIECPNQCNQKLFFKDQPFHLMNDCPNRLITCMHCFKTYKAGEIKNHYDICPQIRINCLNNGCDANLPRCEMTDHRTQCLYEKKKCMYYTIGCDAIVLRKDLKSHEDNDQLHLSLALRTIANLKAKVSMHDSKFRSLETATHAKPPRFIFKLSKFSELKSGSKQFNIPSFYSHPGGYKLSSTIYANGQNHYRGKSISLFAFCDQGENDDDLDWPFKGTITIELLNQLEDDNHFARNLTKSNNRVTNERGLAELGYGFHDYIRHTELTHNPLLNRQYLKDDCLFFRFTFLPPQQPRPWLTCTQ